MGVVAIIGGTGLERLPESYSLERMEVQTRFGAACAYQVRNSGREVLFVSRHGEAHAVLPHQINYRANTAAMVQLGVTLAVATNATGSLRADLPPGSLVLLDDFIDITRGRPASFLDEDPAVSPERAHTDFSHPYCPRLRRLIMETAAARGVELIPKGTYVCAEGPRFESPAEVRMFAQWGGDVVGMTGLPEAVFAREAGICYAAVAIVTNYGAGLTDEPVDHALVVERMAQQAAVVRELLFDAAQAAPADRCPICSQKP